MRFLPADATVKDGVNEPVVRALVTLSVSGNTTNDESAPAFSVTNLTPLHHGITEIYLPSTALV